MANIYIYDEFSPEDIAMMQALYSRSSKSVVDHIAKVKETGSGKFMETYYVGYGHASIADCGSTTIFIENLSVLADKAVQDWPLYSGQETSTRYIDMSKRGIIDPVGSPESKAILKNWMEFYTGNQEAEKKFISDNYPKKAEEDEGVYNKAVAARTFDIMRSFLPAGITTQLSWHTNLRQAWDKLVIMRSNPLPEIREIADTILLQLKNKYGHSFSFEPKTEQDKYREYTNAKYNFFYPDEIKEFYMNTSIKNDELKKYSDILDARPPKTNAPLFLGELGTITFDFILDFGSFRDLQRHRNGVCRMPLLTSKLNFNQWYLDNLPPATKSAAKNLINSQVEKINKLAVPDIIKQYYLPLGFNVPCRVTYGLPAALYVIELRSGKFVHQTLRQIAHKMHYALKDKFPDLKIYTDLNKDEWDIRRGLQDITIK